MAKFQLTQELLKMTIFIIIIVIVIIIIITIYFMSSMCEVL